MRVLVLEPHSHLTDQLSRIPGKSHELRSARSLAEARLFKRRAGWRPDAIVAELALPDGAAAEIAATMAELFAEVPLLFATTGAERLERQLALLADGPPLYWSPRPLQDERREIIGEIDVVARRAAEQAVSQALDRLMVRLGLDDEDGVKTAIRLARAYENARTRFWSAITTGLASGLLVALGLGIVALLRGSSFPP